MRQSRIWLGYQAWLLRWGQLEGEERLEIADGSTIKAGLNQLKATDWKEVAQTTTAKLKDAGSAVVSSAESVAGSAVAAGTSAKEAVASAAPVADTPPESPSPTPSASGLSATSATTREEVGGSTPIAAVTAAIVKVKGFFQGRKTHGKQYVRPEEPTADVASTTYETDWDELEESAEESRSVENEVLENSTVESGSADVEVVDDAANASSAEENVTTEDSSAEDSPAEEDVTTEDSLVEDSPAEDSPAEDVAAEAETATSTDQTVPDLTSDSVEESADVSEPEVQKDAEPEEPPADEDYSQEPPEEDYSQEVPNQDYSQELPPEASLEVPADVPSAESGNIPQAEYDVEAVEEDASSETESNADDSEPTPPEPA